MLARLAVPNILAVATMTVVTFADVYFVGHLGTTALASLAVVFPFQTLLGMTSNGAIGGGVASSIARALGADRFADAESAAWHSLLVAGLMSAIYVVLLGMLARPVLSMLGVPENVLDGAVEYSRVLFLGAPIVWFAFMMSATLRGIGEMAIAGNTIVVAGVVHIFLSGALTLGWGPFPKIGLIGPAITYLTTHGFIAAYLLSKFWGADSKFRLRPHRFSWKPVREILSVGGPGLVNSSGLVLTVIVVTGFVSRFGEEALAGYGLGSRLELTLVPLAFGVGAALVTAVGANFGAGQFSRARRIAWAGAGFTFAVTTLAGLLVAIFPELWLDRFTSDPAVSTIGAKYLQIAAPAYGIFAAGQTLYFASQGTGRMVLPVIATYSRLLVVVMIGLLALSLDSDRTILFIGVAVGLAVMGLAQMLNVFASPTWNRDIDV